VVAGHTHLTGQGPLTALFFWNGPICLHFAPAKILRIVPHDPVVAYHTYPGEFFRTSHWHDRLPSQNPTVMLPESRPGREPRGLAHIPPEWVSTEATFFITINCQQRDSIQLTRDGIPPALFDTIDHYLASRRWWPEMVLLMPDHLHALVSFSWDTGQGINKVIGDWKRYAATTLGIEWQRDFFDHRIRSESDHAATWDYIRENPVRAGLVEAHDKWPHVWRPTGRGW